MGCVYVFGTRDLLGKRGLISCRMIYAISEPGPQSHTEMSLPPHAVFLWDKAPDRHGLPSIHGVVKDDPELPVVLSVAGLAGL